MKQNTFLLFLIAFLALVTTSCRKPIDFVGGQSDPYLVMVSQPEADSIWMVRVSQSRFFLNNKPIPLIDNARIYMQVNGVDANGIAASQGNGMYRTGICPKPGDSLFMRVVVPDRGEMTAGCRIPMHPTVSNLEIIYDTTQDIYSWTSYSDGTTHYDVNIYGSVNYKFNIHDPAGERNYYMIRQTFADDQTNYIYLTVDDNIIFSSAATEDILDLGLTENYGNRVLFSDEHINGTVHPTTVQISANSLIDYISETDYSIRPSRIEVYALNEELYYYLTTLRAASGQNEFSQILSEPVQVYSNVNGGIGILGGMSKTVIDIPGDTIHIDIPSQKAAKSKKK